MGGNPRALRPHISRPSPLAQVSHQRTLSATPETAELSHDPLFWRRFSLAIQTDCGDVETGRSTSSTSESGVSPRKKHYGDEWLSQQHREKRRCRLIAICITGVVVMVVVSAAVVVRHFT
ncbi:hypothetical protein HI914_01782 [Erysiphe necator]|uniref:Uncharacterized protein n=1 Tax=Uncinula necator TaxID=52586 RepID=A0A0B1PBY5_UNCNE|nr:hypothetical protein HI914_01782 [Erysiphe necator]KHJ34830.1 hypothetical protein EV44_g3178 [Erysiphe necator]